MQQHQAQTDPAPQQLQQHDGHQQHEQAAVPGWQSYSSVFTAAKAGMGGVDQQKVKQVVYEMSKVRPAELIVLYVQAAAGHHLQASFPSLSAGSRSLQPHPLLLPAEFGTLRPRAAQAGANGRSHRAPEGPGRCNQPSTACRAPKVRAWLL